MDRLAKQLCDRRRHAAHSDNFVEVISLVYRQSAKRGFAEAKRLIESRVEHGGKIAGRAVDDLQHLGGRSLLLQSLARLGQEPRVLHCNDRLRREILQQRNLLVGKGPDLLAVA
jgi:hypothetical protein